MDSSGLGSDWTYLTHESETDELITDEELTTQTPECKAIGEQLLKESINPVMDEITSGTSVNVECTEETIEIKDKTESPHGSDSSLSSDVDVIDESSDSNVAAPETPYTCVFNFSDSLNQISVPDTSSVLNCAESNGSSVEIKPAEEIPSNAIRYPTRKEKVAKRIFKSPSVDHSLNTLLSEVSNIKQIAPNIKTKNGKNEKSSRPLAKKLCKSSTKRLISTNRTPNYTSKRAAEAPFNNIFRAEIRGVPFDVFLLVAVLSVIPPFISYLIIDPIQVKNNLTTTETIARDLELFKDDMLKCLGLQHLKALEHKDQELLVQDICVDNPDIWKAKFPRLVNNTSMKLEILKMFDSAQNSSEAAKPTSPGSKVANFSHFSLAELIIRQMDYFEMMPNENKTKNERQPDFEKLVFDDENLQNYLIGQLQDFIDVLDAADIEIKTRVKELKSKMKSLRSYSLFSLESRIYKVQMGNAYLRWQLQDVLFQYKKQDFSRLDITSIEKISDNLSHSSKVEDLLQKIMVLMSSNDKLNKVVSRLKKKNAILEYGFTTLDPTFGYSRNPVFVTDTSSGKTSAETRETDANTNLQIILKRYNTMQNPVLEELHEAFKWNGFFLKFMQELKESTEEDENGHWSWNDIKAKITDVVSKTRSDLSEKFATVEDLDISKIVQKYIDDGKKPLGDLLDSVGKLIRKAQTKGRELAKKTLPDLQAEFAISGVWSMLGGIQKKWADIKQNFQNKEENFSERSQKMDNAPMQSRTNDDLPIDDKKDIAAAENDIKHTTTAENDIKHTTVDTPNKDKASSLDVAMDHEHAPKNEDLDLETFKESFYKLKLDWFLKRALARENIRLKAGIPRYPNWYLLRGLSKWRSEGMMGYRKSKMEL